MSVSALNAGDLVDQSTKPIPAKSILPPTLALLAVFFAVMGCWLWTAKGESERKGREARGIENFSSVQLEIWKECDKINGRMQSVFELVEQRISSNDWIAARQLIMPKECKALQDAAARNRAARAQEGR